MKKRGVRKRKVGNSAFFAQEFKKVIKEALEDERAREWSRQFVRELDAQMVREAAASISPRTGLTVEKLRKALNILYRAASEPRRRRK